MLALVDHTPDWNALVDRLGPWVMIHGALMVLGGLAFWSGGDPSGSAPALDRNGGDGRRRLGGRLLRAP
jgi:hypothetical protein